MNEFCGAPFWDPDLTWNSENPDFTQCFQETILIWTPCGFLWLFTLLEIYYMKTSRYKNIPWGFLNITKFIILFLMIILTCTDLIMAITIKESQKLYYVHITTPFIKIITFILAAVLMYFNKKYGIQSSGVKCIFYFLLTIFAIPQFRSLINSYTFKSNHFTNSWKQYKFMSYIIYYPLTLLIFLLSCFPDKHPLNSIFKKQKQPSPELNAGFLSKIFFYWFDTMIWRGYSKPLDETNIWENNPEYNCNELTPQFDKYWNKNVDKLKQDRPNTKTDKTNDVRKLKQTNGSILPVMIKAFGGQFWFAGFLKIFIDALSFASPFVLRQLINFPQNNEPLWKGYFYATLLFFIAILTSLFYGQYYFKTYLIGFKIRSALVAAIYQKALKISSSAKRETTVGEIVNLMSVDAQRFFELVSYLHLIWSSPITIGIVLYFLWGILGPSVMAGFIVLILMLPLNGWISAKLRDFQIGQMKAKDIRIKFINEILNGIKVLKLYAWELSFIKKVQNIRDKEMLYIKKIAYYRAGTFFVWTCAPFLVAFASFTTFVLIDENNILDAEIAFVSLALFNILRFPMAAFPMMISLAMQTWVSITRINKFLNAEEIDPSFVTHEQNENALQIKNGTFTWGELNSTSVLTNINMNVTKNALIAVVGKVGCGKSSLISSLLGEMEKLEGYVNTFGSIAYVPQQSWIQNCTLKDNILFGKEYDKKFYEKVIDACALTPDIKMLPGGDLTEIGEKGINLSGGQKQRVSLARAVYSNKDIYLLDDPLSAVDSHVGKHIFDHLIGPNGLLMDKTRLLVTHGISFLPLMDNIIVMKEGQITESGSYKHLMSQKGAFSEFLIEHLEEMFDNDEELENIKEALSDTDGRILLERAMSTISKSSNESLNKKSQRKSSAKSENDINEIKSKTKLIHNEESATGHVQLEVYINYFKSIGLKLTILLFVLSVVNQASSVYANTWLTIWTSDKEAHIPDVRNLYITVYALLAIGLILSMFGSSIVLAIGSLKAARDLHDNLLNHCLRLPMQFFDTQPLGRIMNRFSKDVDIVDNIIPMSIRGFILMIFNVAGILIVISTSTPLFMAVILPIAIIYYYIQKFYIETSRQLKRLESVTRSPIYSHFSESIIGQSTIRAYNVQQRFTKESEEKVDYNQMCSYPSIIANRWLAIRLEIVGSLIILFAALFAVLGRETISAAIVGFSISYALQTTQVLGFLVRMTADVETNIVAIERIKEYSELPQEKSWDGDKIEPEWPKEGKIEFKNLKLRYRDGLDLVLNDLSFIIKPCEKIGIIGRTGAGKSSLTLALFRIIEAAEGKIIIDDIDISQLGLHSLRQKLTIIPQDPVLFSGTLRMNIDPFNIYNDDEIWLALEHSHLKSFVKGLHNGILHEINEGGDNLSVGQRQLICLARALLRKTKILVLDEATAAVDLETDNLIQKTIRTKFSDCTILTIAHRLNTIMDSDKVIVLDKGSIAEFDTPKNLLQNPNTIFYGMAKESGLV